MILLDTDHISILKYAEHPRTTRLDAALGAAAAREVVATTIISAEEQTSGWLARIRREKIVHQQVGHYRQLKQLFDFYGAWRVEPFDDRAADVFCRFAKSAPSIGNARPQNRGDCPVAQRNAAFSKSERLRTGSGFACRELAELIRD